MFSSAKETDTAKQNRISPVLIEALQLLKFSLKKECLNFMAGWSTSETTMSGVSKPTHDLGSLFVVNHNAALDHILKDFSTYDCEI
jgi:hypothetical protein